MINKIYPGVGVAVIVERDGKILMLRRRHERGDGPWSTPGGHLECGEHPENCGMREVLEETEIVVNNLKFVAITNDVFENEKKHSVTMWF